MSSGRAGMSVIGSGKRQATEREGGAGGARRAWVEGLEQRALMSAGGTATDAAAAAALADATAGINQIVSPNLSLSPSTSVTPSAAAGVAGLTPAQVRKAYGFDQVTLKNGVKGDG